MGQITIVLGGLILELIAQTFSNLRDVGAAAFKRKWNSTFLFVGAVKFGSIVLISNTHWSAADGLHGLSSGSSGSPSWFFFVFVPQNSLNCFEKVL